MKAQPRNLPLNIPKIARKINKPMTDLSERTLERLVNQIDETYMEYMNNGTDVSGEYHSVGKLVSSRWGITNYDVDLLDNFVLNQEF